MALAIPVGSLIGLNFAEDFMFACVAFVAVAFWVDHKLARRRTLERRPAEPPVRDPADS